MAFTGEDLIEEALGYAGSEQRTADDVLSARRAMYLLMEEWAAQYGATFRVRRYFVKPLHDYKNRLPLYKVHIMPYFVIDDYPQVIEAFRGYHISDILKKDDAELLEVWRLIQLMAEEDEPVVIEVTETTEA